MYPWEELHLIYNANDFTIGHSLGKKTKTRSSTSHLNLPLKTTVDTNASISRSLAVDACNLAVGLSHDAESDDALEDAPIEPRRGVGRGGGPLGRSTKMAARMFVSKQFNVPMKLYTNENIANTLGKQSQVLANGALGIDFHKLNRPGHLANSQVLKMLEEEELDEFKHKGFKRIAWPPPPENTEVVPELTEVVPEKSQEPKYTKAKIVPSTLIEVPQPPPRSWESQIGSRPVSTYDSVGLQQPAQATTFRPVNFEPPKAFVKLRPSPPIQQEPPPIFDSQPAVLLEQGGARMRGDQKWPPESYKRQAEAENEARIALARGPLFRPRKVKKDYTSFFAQNALNSTYPSYRAPPGTQHYLEDGTSQF